MAFFVKYEIKTGVIKQVLSMPVFMADITIINGGEALVETSRLANVKLEYIKDGVLTDKPQSMLDTTTP